MVEKKIFAHLSTTTALTALVGTRIYPQWIPDQAKYPAVTFIRISGGQVNSLTGYSCLENPRIQMDVWAETYKQARDLSTIIHSAMSKATGYVALLTDDSDLFEFDIGVYRISMDFSCWNRE